MNIRKKDTGKKREKRILMYMFSLAGLFFFLFSVETFSQDSIPAPVDLTEEKELKFQDFFFKALSEKSLGNYDKALQNLENCNQILTNNVAIYFEFSKNYLELNNPLLAKEYIDRALKKDTSNVWMLKHLVKVYEKSNNYTEAIKVQEKIARKNPKEREGLVFLFLQDKKPKKALSLINNLEKEKGLSARLRRIKNSLTESKRRFVKKEAPKDTLSLVNKFKSDKSYKLLTQILQSFSENPTELLKYSDQGIALFPAQPYVYLMKGIALNNKKEYKKALRCLQNGIDFVIEDKMEANFYEEMATSSKGLGNLKDEKKYRQKSKKIKS